MSEETPYLEFAPSPDLSPYVCCYWTLRGLGGAAERILPDGRPELTVQLADAVDGQARCLFVGQQRQAVTIQPLGRLHIFGVRFRAAGAAGFCGMRQDELAGGLVPLETLWGGAARTWEERLHSAGSDGERVAATEAMLRLQLLRRGAGERVRGAVEGIAGDPWKRIDTLAAEVGLSRRQLEREFLRAVGLPPKMWARIVRLQRALALRRIQPGWGWAEIALASGYYDQAHLIGECRRITGLAPRERESAETAMERMLVANFQDEAPLPPVGFHS